MLDGRYTAAQVLQHPWVGGSAPSTAIDTDNLRKHNAARKLKKAGQKLMVLNRLKAAGLLAKPLP